MGEDLRDLQMKHGDEGAEENEKGENGKEKEIGQHGPGFKNAVGEKPVDESVEHMKKPRLVADAVHMQIDAVIQRKFQGKSPPYLMGHGGFIIIISLLGKVYTNEAQAAGKDNGRGDFRRKRAVGKTLCPRHKPRRRRNMKTGILFLAAALALALGGCALQNADFGTVGAAEPRRAEPLDLGDFSNSYLPPGPAFQNGASVALTQQLIWEAAYDPSVGSPLWQSHGQDASDTRQKGQVQHAQEQWDVWQMAQSPEQTPFVTDGALLP